MTRACIIGDSHIGALLMATAGNRNPAPGLELVYFNAYFTSWEALQVGHRALVATSDDLREKLPVFSDGRTEIAVDDYDSFAIVGLNFGIGSVANLYGSVCCDGMRDPEGDRYQVSERCFLAAAEALALPCEAIRIGTMLRSLTDKPVFVAPYPNPAVGLPTEEVPDYFRPYFEATRTGDAEVLGALFRTLCRKIASDRRLTVLAPPAEAAENGVFNQRAYSSLPDDLTGLSADQKVGAMVHGGGRYGAILLRQMFDLAI